ncbi:DODA-type extradiol aromatic ring-opening family dioxygenase [Shewanella mangrovi]|uniref:DODA-type extradiol aromatic ring-opening family dioxygenase n=1 Tax=Shewanella mangrovi TaxID=1515746 RepID=UPI000565F80E|nr:class III extradiol ring-cleavage dioxygenase [Shewanella mangrovi]
MKTPTISFISHGGGPMPLLNDPAHAEMVKHLQGLTKKLDKPSAILLISAHWEESVATVTAAAQPGMIYDYYGFPAETYKIQYPAPGEPALAEKVHDALQAAGIPVRQDSKRGYDHGLFVPLMLMYPEADIPCVQLSLVNNLSPEQHLAIGQALQALDYDNLLVIGSGFSFHNMREFFAQHTSEREQKNLSFEQWLQQTVNTNDVTAATQGLANWSQAPNARYCQPREEHLLPLHVCYGLAGRPADITDDVVILNKHSSSFTWLGKSLA